MKNLFKIHLLIVYYCRNGKCESLSQSFLNVNSGSHLTVDNATISIGGAVSSSGTFDVTNGTVVMDGSSAQFIPANTFARNTIKNLGINNTVTLQGQDTLTGTLFFHANNKTFNTANFLTLKSTAIGTANVADITYGGLVTGNIISGNVTVERYLSAHKAWKFLSIPTNTVQTVRQAWQEGGINTGDNPVPGYGTQITGSGGVAGGYDLYTATPSMKTYNSATNTWVGIANTIASGIKNIEGYMVFDRGDRTANAYTSISTQTVLRTTGSLYTNDQAPIVVNAGTFTSIGNPYASALDMRNIAKPGVKDFFYLWDPKLGGSFGLGGYQAFSNNGSGNYIITPGGGSYDSSGSVSNYIQSGQAFLVQGDTGGGNLTFTEASKADSSRLVSRPTGLRQPQLRTNLYGINTDNTNYMLDGFLVTYDDLYSNAVDDMDAIKPTNFSENLSVKTGNNLLVIERRQTISKKDTVFLNLTNMKARPYRFEFSAHQLDQPGLTGFLEDSYLHTRTPINLNRNTFEDFSVVNNPGSYAPDRFRIVFMPALVLPLSITNIKAYQKDKDIAVEWQVVNENHIKQYELEKSIDGNHFSTSHTTVANNMPVNNYTWLDINPSEGYNYYRVLNIDANGKKGYSTIVKVLLDKGQPGISVYPNPVANGIINIEFTKEPPGMYGIRLLNKIGQVIVSKQINHSETSSSESIPISKYAAHGLYQLELTKPNGDKMNMNVIY